MARADKDKKVVSGTAGLLAVGAAIGAFLGPLGSVTGAVIGGVGGFWYRRGFSRNG